MASVVELKQQRAQLVSQAREIIDTAEGEGRDLSADEQQTYDRLDGDISTHTSRIERQEREEQRARDMAEPPAPRPHEREESEDLASQFRELAAGDRRRLDLSLTNSGGRRDLVKGTNSSGGYTVPETFVSSLYEYLTERSAIRQTNVTVLTTSSGEKMLIPKVTDRSTASRVAEGGTLSPGDPAFGQEELDAHKYGQLLQLSTELISDTGVNILDFIARDAGRALGEVTGTDYITGDGSNQPMGILEDSTAGVTAAAADAITADELIDLFYSVIGPYRRNGYWMMNDSTARDVRKLKDDNGQYLWQQGLQQGAPDMILDRPVVTDHNMPAIGAENKSVLFGDFSGYYIRDVGSMRFERSDQFAFDSDLVTFRSIMRTDGKLVDTSGAVKHLVHPTAA